MQHCAYVLKAWGMCRTTFDMPVCILIASVRLSMLSLWGYAFNLAVLKLHRGKYACVPVVCVALLCHSVLGSMGRANGQHCNTLT